MPPKGETRPADVIGASCRSGLARLPLGAFIALGQGQKSESARRHVRGRRGLGFFELDKKTQTEGSHARGILKQLP